MSGGSGRMCRSKWRSASGGTRKLVWLGRSESGRGGAGRGRREVWELWQDARQFRSQLAQLPLSFLSFSKGSHLAGPVLDTGS